MFAPEGLVGPGPDTRTSYQGLDGGHEHSPGSYVMWDDAENRVPRAPNHPTTVIAHASDIQLSPSAQPSTDSLSIKDPPKLSKSTKKAQAAVSAPKRARLASTSKAKDSGDVEGKSVTKKARVKASKPAGVTGSAGDTKGAGDGIKKMGKARNAGDAMSGTGGIAVKVEVVEEKPVTRNKKTKTAGVSKPRTAQLLITGQPKWSVVKPVSIPSKKVKDLSSDTSSSELKPAIWANSKEELLSALPELAKATNGISWVMSETPVLVLEERNIGLDVSNVLLHGKPSMELKMTRDFICTPSDLATPLENVQSSHLNVTQTPPINTPVTPNDRTFNHTTTSNPQRTSHISQPLLPSPRKTDQGVDIVEATKTKQIVKTDLNFDALYTILPEPNVEDHMMTGSVPVIFHTPTVAHQETYRPSNANGNLPGSNTSITHHPIYYPRASEKNNIHIPSSSPLLKRGPDTPAQLDEVSSKRIKLELMTSSVWGPANDQQQPRVPSPLGNENAHLEETPENLYTMREEFRCGIPNTDLAFPLSRPAIFPHEHNTRRNAITSRVPPTVPHPHVSNQLPETSRPFSQTSKAVLAGLKFTKIKTAAKELSVPNMDGRPLPKSLITPPPDLPLDKPAHQQNTIVKGKPQKVDASGSLSHESGRRIPSTLPSEVQVLLDAYVSGQPVMAIASRAILLEHWGIFLPPELAYAFLGFFRVRRVWENLVAGSPSPSTVSKDHLTGKVEWRFRYDWEPSTDEHTAPESGTPGPWWAYSRGKGKERAKGSDDEETDRESSDFYRMLRVAHPNYKYRDKPVSHGYPSILPRHVRTPDQTNQPDQLFPLGWHCKECGKLNYRSMLRHRTCTSSFCKDRPSPKSYALPLWYIREPQQRIPVPQPYDTYPKGVDARFALWGDDMRTYTYVISGDVDETVTVKHVFTCNNTELQQEATDFLEAIQLDVPIQRKIGKATLPYFEFEFGSGSASRILSSPPIATWENAPPCVVRAREHLVYCGQGYGEKVDFTINTLSVLAWITSGTRKGPSILPCKSNSIIIICLGADVVISVTPKSGFHDLVGPSGTEANTSMLVDEEAVVTNLNSLPVGQSHSILGDDMDIEPDTASDAPVIARAGTEPFGPFIPLTEGAPSLGPNSSPGLGDDMDVDPAPLSSNLASTDDIKQPTPVLTTEQVDTSALPMNEDDATPGDDMEPESTTGVPTSARPAAKPPKPAISTTLLHGDILILSGDDFEYSIKRSGTTILLIGS